MKKTYIYFQPEYVSKFKCNGQACSAHCCKNWRIDIDKSTYKKYSHIKPKMAAQEITKHLSKSEIGNFYTVKLDAKGRCPMLTEENYCMIQKKYGEDYLSSVCATYPRHTWRLGDFYERSLSLTCPVVGALVLMNPNSLAFEQVEVSEKVHSNQGRIIPQNPKVPPNLFKHMPAIQTAAISILQERTFTIDQRLIVVGFFLDKLDEFIKEARFEEIDDLAAFYMSEDFLHEQALNLAHKVKFDEKEHMRIILETFETLYGGDSIFLKEDKKFVDAVVETLKISVGENEKVSLNEIAENYKKFESIREVFMNTFSAVFENYLVNEFFMHLQPFQFNGSIVNNYGFFLTIYKILELITMSVTVTNFRKNPEKRPPLSLIDLGALISVFANRIDHNRDYIVKIIDNLKAKGRDDMLSIMQSLLEG